jgi:alpha-aminoadipic semialdehyde synthase
LAYLPHERDSALLHHSFKLQDPAGGGGAEQEVTASLLCYGSDEGSAMSITVGKTLAFAALRVLDGHVTSRGVVWPYEREIWQGVLDSLEEAGVRVEEKWA